MLKGLKSARIFQLMLLAVVLTIALLASYTAPVDAATCPSIGCGSWTYFGCCSANTKLYQQRTCCNGPTCCNQYRCTTSPCFF